MPSHPKRCMRYQLISHQWLLLELLPVAEHRCWIPIETAMVFSMIGEGLERYWSNASNRAARYADLVVGSFLSSVDMMLIQNRVVASCVGSLSLVLMTSTASR